MAASFRRIISSPAPRRFHPGACKRRQGLTGWSSITPSSTAAAARAQSSAAFISRRSWENHPSPKPLPRQIPIGQPPLSRGFLLRGLSDAGPARAVDPVKGAGVRNPSRLRSFARRRPAVSSRPKAEVPGVLAKAGLALGAVLRRWPWDGRHHRILSSSTPPGAPLDRSALLSGYPANPCGGRPWTLGLGQYDRRRRPRGLAETHRNA